jgi:UDP-N-acetyl-D-mannosaminuronic acid dehydrogenase
MMDSPDIAVIGLGRTGLPQSVVLACAGWKVLGVDTDSTVCASLRNGEVPFQEPGMAELLRTSLARQSLLIVPSDEAKGLLKECEAIIIAVATPYDPVAMSIGTDGLFAVVDSLFESGLRLGASVICRVTVPVGTTDSLRSWVGERHNKREGLDFHLAYVPERVAEGAAIAEESELPKLIGAYSDSGFASVRRVYARLAGPVIRMESPSAAEFSKLMENSWRNLRFAFSNEVARLADAAGIDAQAVIIAGNTAYPRNSVPLPGPVSGYCLGKDPYIFGELSKASTTAPRGLSLSSQGRMLNDSMYEEVARASVAMIPAGMAKPRIALLGLSFKQDVDDFRMSHALAIAARIIELRPSVEFALYDPALHTNRYTQVPQAILSRTIKSGRKLTDELMDGVHVAIVMTPHRELRNIAGNGQLKTLLATSAFPPPAVYDCWGTWRAAAHIPGVIYRGWGFGSKAAG